MYSKKMKVLKVLIFILVFLLISPCYAQKKSNAQSQPKTLDEYEVEDAAESHPAPHKKAKIPSKKNLLRFSQTEIMLGGSVGFGTWMARPSEAAMMSIGVGQFLYPKPFYVNLQAVSTFSFSEARNFILAGLLGGGYLVESMIGMPFIGLQTGISRVVATSKGRLFSFVLGPEIGFFPTSIKEHLLVVRLRYNWMTAKLDGASPAWVSLLIGIDF